MPKPRTSRLIVSAALLAALTAAAVGGPARAQTAVPCAAPAGTSVTFNHDGQPKSGYQFKVPEDVTVIRATVEGGHGGEFSSTGLGGAGGGVEVAVHVKPGECLTAIVGEYGYHGGGDGYGDGGDHGTIPGGATNPGSSAAGGGGASAILRSGQPLVVAGGGGGGGGDGSIGSVDPGGTGGDGGFPASNGKAGADGDGKGGGGGRAGGEKGTHGGGGEGESGSSNNNGAGGGGGGGVKGGKGGDTEGGFLPTGGGGGGGGGTSASFVPIPLEPGTFFTSLRKCEYKHFSDTCHGQVQVSWKFNLDPLNPALLPDVPVVRVLPTDLTPAIKVLPVNLSPVAPRPPATGGASVPVTVPVKLKLLHRRNGKYRKVTTAHVVAKTEGATQVDLPLTRKVRRILRDARLARFRLIATDQSTGQRIGKHRLRLD